MTNPTKPTPMQQALELARQAAAAGEVPVGAVIVKNGEIIATAQNEMKRMGDPTAHAEMQAMRKALEKLGTGRLDGCDLYVTLEPCTMCAGAIAHAKLQRVYYGAEDVKGGAVDNGVRFFNSPTCHHHPEVISGIGEAEAAELLIQFFADRRS
ncbi:tRNA(adenine34) deaminase [Maritalea mobilis]|uniref:tRNA-specific adenosine deaminase n=2 Tax=Maritalea mobilis TaxID=483324 RepID=A0A4V3DAW7_9HYPH|nr:tRNA(adenine34) deaminase [Maritalea mobilis]